MEFNNNEMPAGALPPIAVRSIRNKTAISLQEPDRVPFMPSMNNFYALHYGVTIEESMKDARSLIKPLRKFCEDYDPDWVWNPVPFPIKPMETIGHKQARWPGAYHNLPANTPYQYVDRSYLSEDDWEDYFRDPSYYIMHNVLPEKFGALKGLGMINPYATTGQVILSYMQFANPAVQDSLKALMQTANEVAQFMEGGVELIMSIIKNGYPVYGAAPACCAFDDFADNVRGLMELCMDIITDPEYVDEALEKWSAITIPAAISAAKMAHSEDLFIPLHCGVDNFMSLENYEKHYWPTLKKLIDAAVKADLTPIVFCEGKYDTRLDCITDVPKGKVLYNFENVDYAAVKKIVGPYAAIGAGMRTQTLMNGTPEQVEDEVRRSLDILAPGGGFFMSNSFALDDVPAANMHAWRNALEKYGRYR
ncbi:MAG: hypothetical protein HUJ76_05470 [Parasporobacterium sp.]|nr:hypothetical protein [Parasporobacterium sp.]